jgi:hypothetical protein
MTSCLKTTEHRFWTMRIEAYSRIERDTAIASSGVHRAKSSTSLLKPLRLRSRPEGPTTFASAPIRIEGA